MDWRLTILCENTVSRPGLLGEHGFSAYIELPSGNILFDTGQGFGLIQNALRLEKSLPDVSQVVLSHGHYDHTGGLLSFLAAHGPCDVVAHPDVLAERFSWLPSGSGEKPLSIGMPWPEAYITTRGARFQWCTTFTEIAENVFVTGEVPRCTPFELGDPKMKVLKNGQWVIDPFLDDCSLVLKTRAGLVIVLGCAHSGLINILEYVTSRLGQSRIRAIVGGTHLGFLSNAQLHETILSVRKYDVELLAVSHCTGQRPVTHLASEFGERFAFGNVGFTLSA